MVISNKWNRTNIYLTDAENSAIEQYAYDAHMKKGKYIRFLAQQEILKKSSIEEMFYNSPITIDEVYQACAKNQKIIIAGGTGTGKTTLLKSLMKQSIINDDITTINIYNDETYEISINDIASTNNTAHMPNVHYYYGNNEPTVYTADQHTLDIIEEIGSSDSCRRFIRGNNKTIATIHSQLDNVKNRLACLSYSDDTIDAENIDDAIIVYLQREITHCEHGINDYRHYITSIVPYNTLS